MSTMSSLPPEMIREMLRYLPIRSLLDFGLTSKNSHALQSCSLSKLRLTSKTWQHGLPNESDSRPYLSPQRADHSPKG